MSQTTENIRKAVQMATDMKPDISKEEIKLHIQVAAKQSGKSLKDVWEDLRKKKEI